MSNDAEILQQDIARTSTELSQLLSIVRNMASENEQLKKDVVSLTVMLSDIIKDAHEDITENDALYIRCGGGWARLPNRMTGAINAAKRYLGLVT